MPTLSEQTPGKEAGTRNREWTARSDTPRRSVFGNYRAEAIGAPVSDPASSAECYNDKVKDHVRPLTPSLSPTGEEGARKAGEGEHDAQLLQTSINIAIARSFLHRFLAQAYEDPTPEGWRWLTNVDTLATLRAAVATLMTPGLEAAAHQLAQALTPDAFESYSDTHRVCFGHAARGSCPLNEIEYGDIKADGLFQPHRLADLAAFYRAFGLDVADDATERQDHICLELEFMTVLAAKEAYALEHQLDASELAVCRDAQKKFLREHLGRWTPGFARRLARMADGTPLAALADFTRAFIESECASFQVPAGSEDLLLRPVDEAAESLCASCSLAQLPPGAAKPAEDL